MLKNDILGEVLYKHSGEAVEVSLSGLVDTLADFLDHFPGCRYE